MTEEDARALDQAREIAQQRASEVREIMDAQGKLHQSLLDAQGRSQAAQAALVTVWAQMVRRYGREEVEK